MFNSVSMLVFFAQLKPLVRFSGVAERSGRKTKVKNMGLTSKQEAAVMLVALLPILGLWANIGFATDKTTLAWLVGAVIVVLINALIKYLRDTGVEPPATPNLPPPPSSAKSTNAASAVSKLKRRLIFLQMIK